jgi:eukaryotic translation initiation factor 2C
MDLVKQLQTVVAPQLFTPRAVYDGRKNIFSARELPFGETGIKEESVLFSGFHRCILLFMPYFAQFDVSLADSRAETRGKGPKVYKIRLTKVAEINPE